MSSRRIHDIPFPSFSLVMSQSSTSNMRLPSYRTSYLLRFHPYPRVKPSQRESLMNTVDDRLSNQYDVVDEDNSARPVILDFSDVHEEQHPNVENLQEAVEVAEAGVKPRVRRLSLTTLIIDLALLVARKLALKAR
ncbi:hypothetical protein DFJ58DRAFT_431856 [Suillus subalutaceus]|uniref:uncharacterized protein n=1 Tax=Suillus subalutaceus TaxID=48586 RepID=UPI001B86B138|nr:uncharacterized protein DFJ58DRAFT_431856 [Suillus subalutaceus]KAG1850571.1 hypothetical protein DFJ58DRAFT_431856 [Suillus subalutaceus]